MQNTEYDKEYYFYIDQYLIEKYDQMNLATRRAIFSLALGAIDDEIVEGMIDEVVAQYAIDKLNFRKPEDPNESSI